MPSGSEATPVKSAPPPIPFGSEKAAALSRSAPAVALEPEEGLSPVSSSALGQLLGQNLWVATMLPVAAVALLVGLWWVSYVAGSRSAPPEPALEAEPPTPPPSVPDPAPPQAVAAASRVDPRWVPDSARLICELRLSSLSDLEEFQRTVEWLEPAWRPLVSRVVGAFRLQPRVVRRLSWASTELAAWADRAVVVIELEPGQNAAALSHTGEPANLQLAGSPCHRLSHADWPHPFAVLDQRTIVTGPEELLRPLAARTEPAFQSKAIDRLLRGTTPEAQLMVLVDLEAARESGWPLPRHTLDVWATGRAAWHVLWEVPQGLGVAVRRTDRMLLELALVCENESEALRVREAVAELAPAAADALAAQERFLTAKLEAGQFTAAVAGAYQTLLEQGQAALRAARWEVHGEIVWVRVDSAQGVPGFTLALLESRPAIQGEWLAAGMAGDEANHRGLLVAMDGYRKAEPEHRFPPAVEGGAMLPPDTRLSWIAGLLPYLGHLDWHRQLHFGYSWNGPQNRAVTQRAVARVVNPTLGPSRTDAGFPVTHYVGVAGVGPDAGTLKPTDRRAGVFGFGRRVGLDEIGDGAGNTIALLGVSGRLGAWAAGGAATVRPLTTPPYVNGPDGFGSGQPNGMLAGMADGSVRFISKDVDPRVLEQLATINGADSATAAALAPVPRPLLPPKPQLAAAKPAPTATEKPPPAEPEPPADKPPAPKPLDVGARLGETVVGIEFANAPLQDVLALLSQMTNLPIGFDLDAMTWLGVRPRDPVTVRLVGATVDAILKTALAERGLVYVAGNGQLLVTVAEPRRSALGEATYDVSDLIVQDQAGSAALAQTVRTLVAPESWQQAGGRGTLQVVGSTWSVSQTEVVHAQLRAFCEKLRIARGKPPQSRDNPARFPLATRSDLARPKLAQPITINHEAAPLEHVVADLAQMSQTTIVVDWLALSEEEIPLAVRGTVKVQDRPLQQALSELLAPVGLACRIVEADLFEVTGRKTLGERLELEFFPVRDLVPQVLSAAALVEKLKSQVGGATWNDAGGPAVLHFDEPGACLIVLQSQPNLIAIQTLLAELRTKRSPSKTESPPSTE